MTAFVNRVTSAVLAVRGSTAAEINRGYMIQLAVADIDKEIDAQKLVNTVVNAPAFNNAAGKPVLSLMDIKGDVLILPDENVLAKCIRGRRPIYDEVADITYARHMYESVIAAFRSLGIKASGTPDFGGRMDVCASYDGFCTYIVDTFEK